MSCFRVCVAFCLFSIGLGFHQACSVQLPAADPVSGDVSFGNIPMGHVSTGCVPDQSVVDQSVTISSLAGGNHFQNGESAQTERATGKLVLPDAPFDNSPILNVLDGQIDNGLIYNTFLNRGMELVKSPDCLSVEAIDEQLKLAHRPASIRLPAVSPGDGDKIYETMVKSSVMIGVIYDCGRCDNLHANIAGGVIISADGLVLTNHHVISRNDEGVKGLLAMTHDGRCFPIVEVLSASRGSDVAVIRIKGDEPFVASPLAGGEPRPLSRVRVMSHPRNEYWVVTEGVVSRHVKLDRNKGGGRWLEITAEFAAGSSGSAIFNERGEIVGLVSRVSPIFRGPSTAGDGQPKPEQEGKSTREPYVEMILRRCVPLDAIMQRFQGSL